MGNKSGQGRRPRKKKGITAEATIQRLMDSLSNEENDALVAEPNSEWDMIAQATMAWQTMFYQALGIKSAKTIAAMGSSLIVLASIMRRAYGLGIKRGKRG